MFKDGDKVIVDIQRLPTGTTGVVLNRCVWGDEMFVVVIDSEKWELDGRSMTLIEPKLTLVEKPKEPTIELSFKVKIQGFTFDLSHGELREIQTVINGVL